MIAKMIFLGLFAFSGVLIGWRVDTMLADLKLCKHTCVSGIISVVLFGFLFLCLGGVMTIIQDLLNIAFSVFTALNRF